MLLYIITKEKGAVNVEEKIYTVEEIAEKLKVRDYTVRGWLRTGKLQGFKMGGRDWRVKESELSKFINGR